MRIRCPDTSPTSSVVLIGPINPPNYPKHKLRPLRQRKKVTQSTQPTAAPPLRRSTSSLRRREQIPGKLKRTDSASLAAKKEQRRVEAKVKSEKTLKEVPVTVPKRQYSFVYAGNLKPTITEEQLRARFLPCGPILRIVIRCSSGQVTTVYPGGRHHVFGPRDRKYASIEFRDSMAYLRALRLNGHLLDGVEMIVSTSAADLPEAKEIGSRLTSSPAQPHRIPRSPAINSPYRTPIPNVPNSKLQRNSRPPDATTTTEGDRFRFLGLSFAKCII